MRARPLEVLVGVRAIARFLKVSNRAVLAMEERGAPIVRDERNWLRAEKNTLWAWYVRKRGGAGRRRVASAAAAKPRTAVRTASASKATKPTRAAKPSKAARTAGAAAAPVVASAAEVASAAAGINGPPAAS